MAYDNDILHPEKEAGYPALFGDLSKLKTIFLMPSAECRDVRWLLDHGVITTDTLIYAAERDQRVHARMVATLRSLGFSREAGNLKDYLGELHLHPEFDQKVDLFFIDLLGTITMDIARWMANTMSKAIAPNTRFCFTASLIARNNVWVDEVWRIFGATIGSTGVPATQIFQEFYPHIGTNEARTLIWLHTILSQFAFKLKNFRTHTDTVPMFSVYFDDFVREPSSFSQEHLESQFDQDRIKEFYTREEQEQKTQDDAAGNDVPEKRLSAADCKAKVVDYMETHNHKVYSNGCHDLLVFDLGTNTAIYWGAKSYFELLERFNIS